MVGQFENWRNIFYGAKPQSVESISALTEMIGIAKTFGQWLEVYQDTAEEDEVRPIIVEKLMDLADNPIDDKDAPKSRRWTRIFEVATSGSWLESRALIRAAEEMLAEKNRRLKKEEKGKKS